MITLVRYPLLLLLKRMNVYWLHVSSRTLLASIEATKKLKATFLPWSCFLLHRNKAGANVKYKRGVCLFEMKINDRVKPRTGRYSDNGSSWHFTFVHEKDWTTFWGLTLAGGGGLSLQGEIVSVTCNGQFQVFMLLLFLSPPPRPHGPSWLSPTFLEKLSNQGLFQQSLETDCSLAASDFLLTLCRSSPENFSR